jgi:hypothetical protein
MILSFSLGPTADRGMPVPTLTAQGWAEAARTMDAMSDPCCDGRDADRSERCTPSAFCMIACGALPGQLTAEGGTSADRYQKVRTVASVDEASGLSVSPMRRPPRVV